MKSGCISAGFCTLLVAGAVCLQAGCAGPSTRSNTYIDEVLTENLGDVDALRAAEAGATQRGAAAKPVSKTEPVAAPVEQRAPAAGATNQETATVAPVTEPAAEPVAEPAAEIAESASPAPVRESPPTEKKLISKTAAPVAPVAAVVAGTKKEDVRPAKVAAKPVEMSTEKTGVPLVDLPDLPAEDVPVEAAEESAPAPGTVTIQPDTVLWISVEEDPSLNGKYVVNESSAIDFGYAGLVLLNDMTTVRAEEKLKSVLENRYLRQASVSVRIAKASYDRVGISGAVTTPGLVKIGPGSTITLNDALRRAGGLRTDAGDARVKVIRGGLLTPWGSIAEGEVYNLVSPDGRPSIPKVLLSNNDMVYVLPHQTTPLSVAGEKKIILLGEVSRQGVIQFADNEPCTMLYLLFKIGGLPRFAKANAIRIVRRDKDGSEKEIQVDAENLLQEGNPKDDVILENGDRVIVPARRLSFF